MCRLDRLIWPALALALWVPVGASAMDVLVAGGWSESITAADLSAGAGSDLVPTYESVEGEVTVDISGVLLDVDAWRIDVHRSDSVWDANVRVWVRRTSTGTGTGTITGGEAYVEVTSFGSLFFSGEGNRDGIGLQLKISGVSVDVPPDTYAATLVYTLVDT